MLTLLIDVALVLLALACLLNVASGVSNALRHDQQWTARAFCDIGGWTASALTCLGLVVVSPSPSIRTIIILGVFLQGLASSRARTSIKKRGKEERWRQANSKTLDFRRH